MQYDVVVLTESKYMDPDLELNAYNKNVIDEDQLVVNACLELGLSACRKSWDDPMFDWSTTKSVVFRTTWDYFHRFPEFSEWLKKVEKQTILFNSAETIHWNIDKKYLKELEQKGVGIAKTEIVKQGDKRSLEECFSAFEEDVMILKPCVSGAARHTYKLSSENIDEKAGVFKELIQGEDMMLQRYEKNIQLKGEVSHMIFDGIYSHSVLKKAKQGDFRVQDDWGGTLHDYTPTQSEMEFAQKAVQLCGKNPLYARVDVMWGDNDELLLAELELIEPELWFRRKPEATKLLAKGIQNRINACK